MVAIENKEVLFGGSLKSTEEYDQFFCPSIDIPKFLFKYWDSKPLGKNVSSDQFAETAIQMLEYFIQNNYTGPYLPIKPEIWLPQRLRDEATLKDAIIKSLTVEGERPYRLAPKLLFLLLSQTLFNYANSKDPLHIWYKARLDFLHQQMLKEHVSELFNQIMEGMHIVSSHVSSLDRDLQGRFTMEMGLIQSYYGRDTLALQLMKESAKVMDFHFELTGALGRRTKFQTFDTSQLVVLAKSRDRCKDTEQNKSTSTQPITFELNDDTLLEKISFKEDQKSLAPSEELDPILSSEDPNHPSKLDPLDASLLLAFCHIIKNNNPDDGLTREEMAPYAERVLVYPVNWSVYTMALLVRARLEGFKSRTVERSVLQMQALLDQLNDQLSFGKSPEGVDKPENDEGLGSFLPKPQDGENSASLKERLNYFYNLLMPSRWQLEAELAERFISVGATKSALEIFERLQMWDCVVMCHCSLNRQDLAVQVIKRELENDPYDFLLRTLLGDIENNPKHYVEAWELSCKRFAPAQRSLGKYYYKKGDLLQAMNCFNESLKINPLSYPTWFTYGCAALELQKYDAAMEAFSRCLSINPEDGESWNNLASAMLKAKDHTKEQAWHAMQQGIKYMYDNWRIWENYMLISVDVNKWSEVIRALRRIIEIKGKDEGERAVDVQCLDLVVNYVMQSCDNDASGLARMLNELLKMVVPLITNDVRLWRIVARYYLWRRHFAESLNATLKAYRILISSPNVTSDEATWNKTVEGALELVEAYANLGEMPGRMGGVVAKDWKFKSRSVLRSLIGKGKNIWENTESYQKLESELENLK
ncbi:TPR repeat-containing protein C19B12.01 [Schizosaccharomyces pombe]|uniref:TPR repeat-containing protein C19B12.01 n=1 Tax=Schizosaccharomyces pombe (strain 972 / ATCC 24843) TaxID=284812 RepID=YLM1_SCHPO|nr:TTC27 family TPR repeat-containing protein [Schizosaccharomyces pombe]O36033.2 RecName: Full=TPR repeat-containing protein C19B12.01 [Schizosaccharomyces pombe 972h-]CAB11723.2 TPR repeat protein, TTC27 family [Schizosaccharomyces pombe]|eukprot:NP_594764.2 TTC27 family TPR repeat-containing protein [Schizosaccharomyces pombe]